jgi:hypothetical protein
MNLKALAPILLFIFLFVYSYFFESQHPLIILPPKPKNQHKSPFSFGGGGSSPSQVTSPPSIKICWLNGTEIETINWGIIYPGENKTVTILLKNVGDEATVLTLSTDNFSPTIAEKYLNVTWTYDGSPIKPKQSIETDLTLHVDSNIQNVTDFSFDIIISFEI